jgi:hypothetical protein
MKHSSYVEYFLEMKKTFIEGCNLSQPEKEIDKDFEKVFLDFLLKEVKNNWSEFESNERDTYLLYEDQLDEVWKKSTNEMLGDIILKLSEKGHINTSINLSGDLVYCVSEKGMQFLNEIN